MGSLVCACVRTYSAKAGGSVIKPRPPTNDEAGGIAWHAWMNARTERGGEEMGKMGSIPVCLGWGSGFNEQIVNINPGWSRSPTTDAIANQGFGQPKLYQHYVPLLPLSVLHRTRLLG